MKASTPELRALLESGQFIRVDLYTITLADSEVVRTCTADIDLTWDGDLFPHDCPAILRDKITVALGLEVDTLKLTVYPNNDTGDYGEPPDTVSGVPWGKAIRSGVLDGATVLMQKAYLPDVSSPITGVLHGFEGQVSSIDGGRGEYEIMVKSALELFNVQMPRNVFQATCLHVVYDGGCTLHRADFTSSDSVTGSATVASFDSGLAQVDGYYQQGVVVFTSGVNSGLRRTVKTSTAAGVIAIILPLPVAPTVGDTFDIYPSCDRLVGTCGDKFSNLEHFKGYPYVPTPETVF